ncbi:MAG: YggS family pyridoxal phosphate-dependent enzyme [Acidimicrobiia bacterium]|nr:YggS family pyridoxal phosphate-dependent enzyme [Acidimicrobiia bacterium]MDH5294696.1 YggS family pyridoxal phosphate-dependent enzyme [Acidimicrobiia bacterium]
MGYADVMRRVEGAATRSGRSSEDITVVVVSKGRTVDAIRRVYDQGHRDFAENRAQELAEKAPHLPGDIRWHFVGPLQTNKVRIVRPGVILLHSYDRDDLGRAWMKGPGSAPPVLLQVNIGREGQKHGFDPDDAEAGLVRALQLGLDVIGLMAIPPLTEDSEGARPYFRELASIRDGLVSRHPSVWELSMGMTDDFEVAIEEGATIIRPGRAIFES